MQIARLREAQDRLTEISYNMVESKRNQNTDTLLERIDKNIKLLQYKLSRVVTSFKDYHIVLSPLAPVNIDLIEQTPIYCKVSLEHKPPPLKIYINFKKE